MKTNRLTLAAITAAVAIIMFVIEAHLPPLTAIPGIKIGLSNIAIVFAFFVAGNYYALAVLIVKIVLGNLLAGQPMAMIYSFTGGMLSYVFCVISIRIFRKNQIWIMSAIAAIVHNAGQIIAAIIVTGTKEIVFYLPILAISGMIAGIFTGLCAQGLLNALEKNKLVKIYQRTHK